MSTPTVGNGEEILHHHYAVLYSEDFLKEKGLWDEFIAYAAKRDADVVVGKEYPPIPRQFPTATPQTAQDAHVVDRGTETKEMRQNGK